MLFDLLLDNDGDEGEASISEIHRKVRSGRQSRSPAAPTTTVAATATEMTCVMDEFREIAEALRRKRDLLMERERTLDEHVSALVEEGVRQRMESRADDSARIIHNLRQLRDGLRRKLADSEAQRIEMQANHDALEVCLQSERREVAALRRSIKQQRQSVAAESTPHAPPPPPPDVDKNDQLAAQLKVTRARLRAFVEMSGALLDWNGAVCDDMNGEIAQALFPLFAEHLLLLPPQRDLSTARVLHRVLLVIDNSQPSTTVTHRRLGDQLAGTGAATAGRFMRHIDSAPIRVVSALCLLRSSVHTDRILSALQVLARDLTSAPSKSLFLQLHGLDLLSRALHSGSPSMARVAADAALQLIQSPQQPPPPAQPDPLLAQFLDQAAHHTGFFRACAALYSDNSNSSALESLSIVLQRLSRLASSHRLFASSSLTARLRDSLAALPPQSLHALNIRSILTNLG